MKILITNDDGYKYEALELLVTLSQKYGEVYVVAPKNEQSAKSHSINIREGFEVERINDRFIVISSTTDATSIAGANPEFPLSIYDGSKEMTSPFYAMRPR